MLVTDLHDLQKSLCNRFQRRQSKGLSLVGAGGERTVSVAGAEGYDRSRFDLTDAEQQVELGQGELGQTQTQHLFSLLCRSKNQNSNKSDSNQTNQVFFNHILCLFFLHLF